MDDPNKTPQQEPVNTQPQQPAGPVFTPQSPIVSSPTSRPGKQKRGILIVLILILAAASAGAWFVFAKNNKNSQNTTTEQLTDTVQPSPITGNTEECAFLPEQNYQENEGLYGTWRERAKNVNFDVYLPCAFHKDFMLQQLGIAGGDSDEVVNVFLTFNRPDPEEGDDGLPDDSYFHIRALPARHQPPTSCFSSLMSTGKEIETSSCEKVGDSKFGAVYENNKGDLLLAINNSLIIWTSPPYDDSGDVWPLVKILDSLQKVDPQKLEFFNG